MCYFEFSRRNCYHVFYSNCVFYSSRILLYFFCLSPSKSVKINSSDPTKMLAPQDMQIEQSIERKVERKFSITDGINLSYIAIFEDVLDQLGVLSDISTEVGKGGDRPV